MKIKTFFGGWLRRSATPRPRPDAIRLFNFRKATQRRAVDQGLCHGSNGSANRSGSDPETLLHTARTRFVPPYNVALLHAGLGASDAALEWLEKARVVRDVHIVFLPVEPKWNALRGHPAFRLLLDCCALAVSEVGAGAGTYPVTR